MDRFDHQLLFLRLSQKFFPATYDKTLCKFLLYTYEDSHNLFWSKIISREHVEYIYIAWVENVNFKRRRGISGDPIPYILRDGDFFPNIRAYFEVTKKKFFLALTPA